MDMVQILCKFIKAERTGQWELHLQVVHDILPYLAAAGHNAYTKFAHLYLQHMLYLGEDHPDVLKDFENGLHVIRRSDRYWGGLSTDLVIEQVLMRSVKRQGGLTRGRGMSDSQRLVWLLSMPSCAQVNISMQTLTGVHYETSDQHKDMGKSRMQLLDAFKQWDPFKADTSLRGIVNGVIAGETVNVDQAKLVGERVLESMVGQNVQEYSFKRNFQAVTLNSKTAVTIKDEQVVIDPQLLFQQLSIIASSGDDPAAAFKYELCSFPPGMLELPQLPRGANKAALADAIWNEMQQGQPESVPPDCHYIIDGGLLLQSLPWQRGQRFDQLCDMYVCYVSRNMGGQPLFFMAMRVDRPPKT